MIPLRLTFPRGTYTAPRPQLSLASSEHSLTPGKGLTLGLQTPLSNLGLLSDLVRHAATLRGAIDDVCRYVSLIFPRAVLRLREENELAWLCYEAPFRDPRVCHHAAEIAFTLALRIGRQFAPCANPTALKLRQPSTAHREQLQAVFACEVQHGATRDELAFARTLLDAKQLLADAELHHIYRRHAEQLLGRERTRDALHERVRDVLRHEVDLGFVKAPSIARRLGVTPRSFRRRLSVEGHSLTALADEVRREIAIHALAESDLPIKQIAERVGFGEVSAFHRAFKRWSGGVTPARYRSEAMRTTR